MSGIAAKCGSLHTLVGPRCRPHVISSPHRRHRPAASPLSPSALEHAARGGRAARGKRALRAANVHHAAAAAHRPAQSKKESCRLATSSRHGLPSPVVEAAKGDRAAEIGAQRCGRFPRLPHPRPRHRRGRQPSLPDADSSGALSSHERCLCGARDAAAAPARERVAGGGGAHRPQSSHRRRRRLSRR